MTQAVEAWRQERQADAVENGFWQVERIGARSHGAERVRREDGAQGATRKRHRGRKKRDSGRRKGRLLPRRVGQLGDHGGGKERHKRKQRSHRVAKKMRFHGQYSGRTSLPPDAWKAHGAARLFPD